MIGKREPSGQRGLVDLIFWGLVVIVASTLTGDDLGIAGLVGKQWF